MPPLSSGTKVSINNTELPSSSIKFINANKLEITMPPHTEGKVNITLTNPDNTTTTITNAYEYYTAKAPTITSITPDSSNLTGGTTATLTGTNFNNMKWKQMSAGEAHTCAISYDNKAYCWGTGDSGRLGNGSYSGSSTPVAVSQGAIPASVAVTQVSAGSGNACILASNNKVYCWGGNYDGQLGNGFSGVGVNSVTPVAVSQGAIPTDAYITQISAGSRHTCATASNNKICCWGNNTHGQLGNGTTTNSSTPVQVSQGAIPTDAHITQISAGGRHVCATASNNKICCWGNNTHGQLGNGTTTSSTTPTTTIPNITLKLDTDLTISITGSNFTDTSLSFTIPAYTTPSLKDVSLTNNTTTQNSNTLTSGFRYYSKPNPPTNLTISNSQPTNSLTLTWTSPSTGGIDSTPNQGNNFSPIADYQIDYCIADPNNLNQCQDLTNSTPTTTNPTNWLSYPHTPIQSTGLTNLSTKITNLNPDQHYLIRIAAINQAGLSTYLTSQAKVSSYVTLSATPATTINLTPIYPNTVSTGAVDINFATNMNNGYHLNIEKSGNNTDGFGYSSLDVDGVNQEFPSAGRLGRAEWGFSMPNIPINTTRNQINLSQFTTTQDPVTNQDADLHMDKYSLLWPVTAVNATEIARYNAPDTGRRRIMIGINVPNTQASGTYQVILLFTMIGS